MAGNEILWRPRGGQTNMDAFRERVNEKYSSLSLASYQELWTWSVEHYDQFWEEFFLFSTIISSTPYDEVVDMSKTVVDVPEWFRGCQFNYAENLLQFATSHGGKTALITAGEGQTPQYITFSQLRQTVSTIAAALSAVGVVKGDVVAGYLPNSNLAVEAMLATASLGAVWTSTSPDFGVAGVLDRLSQVKPKIIFSVEAVRYNSKNHDHLKKLRSVVAGLPELERVVLYKFCSSTDMDITDIPNCVMYEEFIHGHKGSEIKFVQVPFNHPLFIMYSSGTTGTPKCMVHSAGGTLIQHLKEHILHGNMHNDDILFYYSTTGWMMWNWMVSALAVGAAIILYDGSPFIPSPSVLWDLVDSLGVTILGTGARWLAALEERSVRPRETHSLSTLHTILSTGSPLKPLSYDYVYNYIKSDVLLGSITGGTDIISCFAGQNPTLPVHRGEIQSRNLGMAVECWDETGETVVDGDGELVCRKPFPSQPTHFWNDDDGIKYTKAYFSLYKGVWAHGDYCSINSETGGITMLGRSDGTLNPSGVRFGSAEIYNIVEHMDVGVADSLCVGQKYRGDERVILFLKMTPGCRFSEEVVKKVKKEIREKLSARHVPHIVLEIADIPVSPPHPHSHPHLPNLDLPPHHLLLSLSLSQYTINSKKVEVAVKKIISGQDVGPRGALANPSSLDLFYNIPELSLDNSNGV